MLFKKAMFIVIPLIISSCATVNTNFDSKINPVGTTVERDLTVYQTSFIPELKPTINIQPVNNEVNNSSETILIDFHNESFVIANYKSTIDNLVDFVGDEGEVFVVGHSHGISSVGVDKLAVKRSNAVRYALLDKGVDSKRIHTLASWSGKKEKYAPSKGVQVIKINNKNLSLALFGA